MSGSRIASLQG